MYFNDDTTDTNIDEEFDSSNLLSVIIETLNKYKFILIGLLVFELIILLIVYFNHNKPSNYLVLAGDTDVTIYQGDSYIENGYEAYNSENVSFNNKVVVDSNLNSNKIGEYEILYKFDNIVKIRKITVVKKPNNHTYIDLTKLNNKTDITINVGDKYNEPGYTVNGNDKNLTKNVRIIGKVDTNKKGEYNLLYTVVDSNGVTVSALRTVTVK